MNVFLTSEQLARLRKRSLELYGLHKDGHEFPVAISLSPLVTEEGVLVTSAIRDITERKRAEESLRDLSGRTITPRPAMSRPFRGS